MLVVLGYDGSLAANAAIRSGAALFPAADAVVVYLCTPPFGSKGSAPGCATRHATSTS